MKQFILASSSSIRSRILKEAGFSFKVISPSVQEWKDESANPSELVLKNAKKKAECVASQFPEELVLGADTVVFCHGKTLCKPKNYKDALRMFQSYRGRQYSVLSALSIFYKNQILSDYDETKMLLRSCDKDDEKEILPKIFSCEKSGGFGIEGLGAMLLDQIDGSFYNVLGLPLHLFYRLLKELPLNIWDFWSKK